MEGPRPKSQLEILAVERQISDLEHGWRRGLTWDEEEAQRAVAFFGLLRHWKGRWGGQPITLEEWQELLLIAPLFGWYGEDGARRFNELYCEIPRKNGKTTLAAGISLFKFVAENEPGVEVYSLATKEEQARYLFDSVVKFVEKSPPLTDRIQIHKNALEYPALDGTFKPLSRSPDQDGLNPHCAILDELHAHRTPAAYNVMDSGTGARENPLIAAITTAGDDRESICWTKHEHARQVLEGQYEDDAFLGFVASFDKGDDWTSELARAKANPNIGVSVFEKDLALKSRRAEVQILTQPEYRQKRLDEWLHSVARFLKPEEWQACCLPRHKWPRLEGRECYGGMDLASTRDLTAFVLVFPIEKKFYVLCWFWLPEHRVNRRAKEGETRYRDWAAKGLLEATPTFTTDQERILRTVNEQRKRYRIQQIAYDEHNADWLVGQLLGDGAKMVPIRQSVRELNEPTKQLDALIAERRLVHEGHKILDWNAECLDVFRDPDGNVRPVKPGTRRGGETDEHKKVDGMVALILALSRAIKAKPPMPQVIAL